MLLSFSSNNWNVELLIFIPCMHFTQQRGSKKERKKSILHCLRMKKRQMILTSISNCLLYLQLCPSEIWTNKFFTVILASMVNEAMLIYKGWNQTNNKINRTNDHMQTSSSPTRDNEGHTYSTSHSTVIIGILVSFHRSTNDTLNTLVSGSGKELRPYHSQFACSINIIQVDRNNFQVVIQYWLYLLQQIWWCCMGQISKLADLWPMPDIGEDINIYADRNSDT